MSIVKLHRPFPMPCKFTLSATGDDMQIREVRCCARRERVACRLSLLFAILLSVCLWPASSRAQNVQHTQNQVDSALRSDMRVDPTTLGLGFQLTLRSYPGRAGSSLPITLSYSSKLWHMNAFDTYGPPYSTIPKTRLEAKYAEGSTAGWKSNLDLPWLEGLEWQPYDGTGVAVCTLPSCVRPDPESPILYVYRLMAHMPDGSTHELRRDDTPTGTHTSGGTYYAVDGSQMRYDATADALYLPDGSRYVNLGTIVNGVKYIDRNGNALSYNSTSKQWTDTLGRIIDRPPLSNSATGDFNYTVKGINATDITYTLRWRNLSNVRTDSTAPLRYSGARTMALPLEPELSPRLFDSTLQEIACTATVQTFNPIVLHQIVLPNGQTYTFTYNVWGEIDKVVYPTGAYERYRHDKIDSLSASLQVTAYGQANRGVVERWVSVTGDGTDELQNHWLYSAGFNNFTTPYTVKITAPDLSWTEQLLKSPPPDTRFGFEHALNGRPYEQKVFSASGQMMRRVLTDWASSGPLPGGESSATRDARAIKQVEILLDTGGNALATTTTYQHDADLNVISTSRYDFVSVDQTTAQTGAINTIPSGALVRSEETTFLVNDAAIDSGTKAAYRARNLITLPTSTRVKNAAGTIVAQSEFKYDEGGLYAPLTCGAVNGRIDPGAAKRGLSTTARSWLNTTGTWLETHAQFDQCGSLRKSWDARGYVSETEYSSANDYAYPTRTISPDPDGAGPVTALETTTIYDLTSGVLLSTTDANGKITTFEYSAFDAISNANPLQRLTKVVQPDGGSTAYGYSDTPGNVYVVTKTALDSSRYLQSTQYADRLGRVWRSEKSEGATSIYVDTQYDVMGRTWKVSNPYRSGETVVWTTTAYDALSRTISVTTPDGAQVGTAYGGNTTGTLGSTVTVTDQVLKKRKSVTDALGRLREVYEDPTGWNYLTSYSYDALDSLTTVTQGSQTRTFAYDSLKRLTSATNPEVCNQVGAQCTPIPVTYQYDNNGNLTQKTDARGITSTYVYDALNRNTSVDYSDATPDTFRQYDLAVNGKGRLNQAWQSGSTRSVTYIDSYDAVGRPKIQRQGFETGGVWSSSFQTQRDYNLAGSVISQTYPSGRAINYGYDDAGRVNSFTGNLGDGVTRTYASGITYSAVGGKQQEQFGTQVPLFHKLHYNVRGQLYDIRLSTVSWQTDQWNWNRGALVNYYSQAEVSCPTSECMANSGPGNNGNVIRTQHWAPANDGISSYNWTEDRFEYDSLNRLKSIAEYHGWLGGFSAQDFTQIYDYDRWGNRTINPATTNGMPETQFTASEVTNRLGVAAGYTGRMDYDAAGNLVNDTYTSYGNINGTPTRLYDADNRLTTAKDGNLQVVSSYLYNADGQRTRRKLGSVETWQVYGMDGELLAEYASGAATFVPTKEYGYRNGELLVTMSSGDDQRVKRFLQALYYGALQVDAPSQWMTDKSNELITAGASSQAQLLVKAKEIARTLFVQTTYETNPFRSDTQYVTDLYYAYLQRGPDAGGLGWWVPQAAGSVQNRINVLNAFEASSEFQTLVNTLYGTATSDGQRTDNYVTNFYQGALGRPPDATELATNSATLNSAVGQSQVISAAETTGRNLFAAQVNDAGLSNTQYVTNLYEGFLQRGPDAGGLGFWSGQASVGQGRQNVLNAFAASSAFSELAGTLYREAYWLVADHLGTPRMVVNKSGSLASVKRHDYLPFGEELGLISGRTSAMGYSAIDNVRQKFTSYERDNETGLDFAQARYFASVQGRFTSPDNFLNDTRTTDPASWNLYVFTRNNPLRYTDPTGEKIYAGDLDDYQQAELLRRTNATYGCDHCTSVGADGYLAVDTTGLNQSVLNAAQSFTDAINSTTYFAQVQVSDNDPNVAFGENRLRRGGVTYNGRRINADLIVLDFGDDRHVGGNERAAAAFLNTVFAHEVAHGYLNIRDPQDRGRTGPTVDVINRITDALGLPRRAEYASDRRGEHWFSIRFQEQRIDRQRRPEVDRNGNPRMRDVYINWIRRNVGGRGVN
jgi:RHS repeat-associated protein